MILLSAFSFVPLLKDDTLAGPSTAALPPPHSDAEALEITLPASEALESAPQTYGTSGTALVSYDSGKWLHISHSQSLTLHTLRGNILCPPLEFFCCLCSEHRFFSQFNHLDHSFFFLFLYTSQELWIAFRFTLVWILTKLNFVQIALYIYAANTVHQLRSFW